MILVFRHFEGFSYKDREGGQMITFTNDFSWYKGRK